ncbi:CotH kinase family protein [Evansella sp. AB-rgal1]|uniref:CotH kinase family protein n=1 Tax=Evansella sp. AB-rgal1 TaxID=3242696 RepID=UPI00359EA5E2
MMNGNFSRGMKVSINYSIKKSFVEYMENIDWDDSKYDSDQFIQFWLKSSKDNASWYKEMDKNLLEDPKFQDQLTEKVNEAIQKIIETEPSEEQIDEIDKLVETLNIEDIDYCCKAEADFQLQKLRKLLQH